ALFHERRRLAAEWRLAQLGRAPGKAQCPIDGFLVRRVRQRLERGNVGRRARRADEGGPEPLRLGGNELDRHALDRDADGTPLAPLDHGDDLGQPGEPREHRTWIRRGARHREQLARVLPPPYVAGRLAVEGSRDAADKLPGAVEQKSLPRSRLGFAG